VRLKDVISILPGRKLELSTCGLTVAKSLSVAISKIALVVSTTSQIFIDIPPHTEEKTYL